MSNWEDDDDAYCTTAADFQDARKVCETLGIPLHRVSFAEQYRERVFSHFLREYTAGRTPNPDVLCNREIKFGVCLDYMHRLGASWIATGHYARLRHTESGPQLLKAADTAKDQSYFLHGVAPSAFTPARVLMQDFTGVPGVVDLAAMREAMQELGGDPTKINPLVPAELVIDHSVMVDVFGTPTPSSKNVDIEFERNGERYRFLRWGQTRSTTSGRAARAPASCTRSTSIPGPRRLVAARRRRRRSQAYPDTLVGTDSTPPWSTASACSAGASAASRPRRPCSASRSRC
jgi:hypothetical protein